MDFQFTPKQREIYELVGALPRKIAPRAAKYDMLATSPVENLQDFRDNGLLKLTISEDLGGMGSGDGTRPGALPAGHRADGQGQYVDGAMPAHPQPRLAPDRPRRHAGAARALPAHVVEDGALCNATGSEPGRTSRGQYNLTTSAERVDGGYVINGLKNYATLGDVADFNIMFAGVVHKAPSMGHLMIVVPKGTPGLSLVPDSWNPMGMRGAASPSFKLENVFVPDSHVLGEPGVYPRERWQAKFHLGFAAQYLGGAEGIFDILTDYLPKRGTAGDSYAQLRVGEIRIGIDSVRWLIYRAAVAVVARGDPAGRLLSLSEAPRDRQCGDDHGQGGAGRRIVGVLGRLGMARFFRDMRIHTLHENLDKTAATIGKFYLGQEFDTTARL
jgi:alkylation response protein AidB-like acyl-CoA dehydrogenase